MPTSGTAVYAFSGDPITYGHLDIIKRARQLFPKVMVAIGTNPAKKYTFSDQQRLALAKASVKHLPGVTVKPFAGLLVDFAYQQGAKAIIKGVRDVTDFQYEQTLNSVGLSQHHGIETIILFAKPELAHVSSSTVKALQAAQGLIHDYVPLPVKVALEQHFAQQTIIGITGEIASGKTYLADQLVNRGTELGKQVHNIDLDQLAHQIQDHLNQPAYKKIKQQLLTVFGKTIQQPNGKLNRKKLGAIVFNDPLKLAELNEIMWPPVLVKLRQELQGKKGLIIINSALLAEAQLLAVCNNRIIFTTVSKAIQNQRLKARGLTADQIKRRLKSQLVASKKLALINQAITDDHFGKVWQVTAKTKLSTLADHIFGLVPSWGIEPQSHVFQTRVVTNLTSLAYGGPERARTSDLPDVNRTL